jgi:hypothetical protein
LCVGSREFVVAKLRKRNPFERRTVQQLKFALLPTAFEEAKVHGLFGVLVRNALDELADSDANAEFLLQFAHKALFECLADLTFSAGKFPKTAEMRVWMTLRDEEFSVVEDQAGGHFNGLRGRRVHLPMLL